MPHRPTKSKTNKALRRASRVRQRQKEKDEFERLEYLKSQLDSDGNPIDILNADESILNNEQKLVKRIVNMLEKVDTVSIANYIDENIDEEMIDNIIYKYNIDETSSTWAKSLFKITYKCMRILGIDDFLKRTLFDNIYIVLENVQETNKQKMSDELMTEIIKESSKDLHSLNFHEIINSVLLVYTQNTMTCVLNGGGMPLEGVFKFFLGRDNGKPLTEEEAKVNRHMVVLYIIILIVAYWFTT